jgi:thymidylate synthase
MTPVGLTAASASELFIRACQAVLATGQRTAPRGKPTLEVLGATLTLTDTRRRLVDVPPARVINPAFAAAETAWILSGSDDPWIYLYNQRLTEFADNGRLMGAYGPRLRRWHGTTDQLARARHQLITDPATRQAVVQAVVQLFDPESDSVGHKDVPCTLGYRFFLRDGLLHMHTTMRSQDLWLGFCYDIFTATILQELMAAWTGARPGRYMLSIDSLHLYETDTAAARQLPAAVPPGPAMPPLAIPWDTFGAVLDAVISGTDTGSAGWDDMASAMASYRIWKAGDRTDARARASACGPLAAAVCRWYDHLERRPATAVAAAR